MYDRKIAFYIIDKLNEVHSKPFDITIPHDMFDAEDVKETANILIDNEMFSGSVEIYHNGVNIQFN
ncbi:hypothetical protein VNN41_06570 [Lactococcus garvieae]|uniref:hypothetical protein n=1 Tax=Lactococcus garvieae TaxID=1363 RepID=UPI0032528B4A